MSQIGMVIIDPCRTIYGRPHASFVDAVVAALSAEPETIDELERALARFIQSNEHGHFATWSESRCAEPFDAGLCIVDLTARLVVLQSAYNEPGPKGEVLYCGGGRDAETWVPYHLSDDWLFSENVDAWQSLADKRRQERLAAPPRDARPVLYGQVCRFIVEECFAARGDGRASEDWRPPEGWSWRALPERGKRDELPTAADAVAEIHARWLMTSREDLQGRPPRDVLLEKRDPIDYDLQDRCHQWSMVGECPPGLSPAAAAFHFAGFGTHENVLYYDLVRHLIWECWERLVEPGSSSAPTAPVKADEVSRLDQVKQQWLAAPQLEELSGKSPGQVIECERMRIPMAVSGEEAIIDEDCPLCQMMAEEMGPVFWNLDGCNMDDDFPFSFHRARESWEDERRKWEAFDRRFEEERDRPRAGFMEDDFPEDDRSDSASVWQRSASSIDPGSKPWWPS